MSNALSIFTDLGDRAGEADALDALGRVYQSQGKSNDAINYYKWALNIRKKIGDRAGEATSQNNLGEVYHARGDYNKAQQAHTKASKIFADPEVGAIAGLANAQNSLGVVYCSLQNYSKSIRLIQEALETRRNIGDRAGEGDSLCNLGNIYCFSTEHQDYQKAEKFYEEALGILQEIGHCEFLAKALNGLGDVCMAQKQYEAAVKTYDIAWQFYAIIGNKKKTQQSRHSQANSYCELGKNLRGNRKYKEAIDTYKKAQSIFVEINDSDRARKCQRNQADTYCEQGQDLRSNKNYQEAIDTYKKAQSIFDEIGDRVRARECQTLQVAARRDQAQDYYNRGKDLQSRKHYQEAIAIYEQARSIFVEIGDSDRAKQSENQKVEVRRDEAENYYTIAEYLRSRKNFQQAIDFYDKVRSIFVEIGDSDRARECQENQADTYCEQGQDLRSNNNYKKAIDAYKQAERIFREIGDNESTTSSTGSS